MTIPIMMMMMTTTMVMMMMAAVGIISNRQTERETGWKYIGLFTPHHDHHHNDQGDGDADDDGDGAVKAMLSIFCTTLPQYGGLSLAAPAALHLGGWCWNACTLLCYISRSSTTGMLASHCHSRSKLAHLLPPSLPPLKRRARGNNGNLEEVHQL